MQCARECRQGHAQHRAVDPHAQDRQKHSTKRPPTTRADATAINRRGTHAPSQMTAREPRSAPRKKDSEKTVAREGTSFARRDQSTLRKFRRSANSTEPTPRQRPPTPPRIRLLERAPSPTPALLANPQPPRDTARGEFRCSRWLRTTRTTLGSAPRRACLCRPSGSDVGASAEYPVSSDALVTVARVKTLAFGRKQSRGAVLGPSLLSRQSERRDPHQSVPLARPSNLAACRHQ
jgi:hypothetical protein